MSQQTITIDTIVDVPSEIAWDRFTEPGHITQWNFASDDWQCPRAENDLRVGGTYTARMEAKDGSFGFDFTAVYDDVQPLRRLSYVMEDGRRVVTTFTPEGLATRVTTTFDAESENDVEMQRAGWQAILDSYRRHVEGG
ncbi:SRPBCC family protein [Pseudooceanicola onchidii]|uniref:SRPBCC family protein n=1 Tax=Pseudooceanicola onchidii TaxID=2562279 RepID=UPI0010AAF2B9|nr:SRPBCC family protein [Pseudooceanicola onchidii]